MRIDIVYIGGLSGGYVPRAGKFKRGEVFSVPEDIARDLLANNPQEWQGPSAFKKNDETTNEQG